MSSGGDHRMHSDNTAQTQVVIESGAVPVLIKLLTTSSTERVVGDSVLALGKIARVSTECRDLLLNSDVLPPLLGLFNDNASQSLMRIATWTLRNLCCHPNPPPNYKQVSQCFPVLSRLIWSQDAEVLQQACWALYGLCEGSNKVHYEHIQVVIESGVGLRALQLLGYTSNEVVLKALDLVATIVTGTHSQAQVLIDANALPALFNLLFHEKESIVGKACLTVANITAGNEQQIQAVIESNLIPSLIELLRHGDISVRKEAARSIANATAKGSDGQIAYIVAAGAIASLCELLSEEDADLIEIVLTCLENILITGELFEKTADSTMNPYATLICNSPAMKLALYSEDTAMQLDATKRFAKLLVTSDVFNLIIDEVSKSGAVPRFVHFLEDSRYPELQMESAWVLTSITHGNSAQIVIESGAVPVLIKLLTASSNENLLQNSVTALGNIARDSTESRDLVLNSNVLPPLLGLFNKGNPSLSMMRIVTWTLARLCKNSPLHFAQVSQCLPLLTRLIVNEDDEVLVNVCQALSRLCDVQDQIQVVIESDVCPRSIQLLSHTSSEVVLEAIRLVCTITAGGVSPTQVLINSNVLPALGSLLSHELESIVDNACRTLVNITAGNEQQIQAVIDANILPSLIDLLHHQDVIIRKEAANALVNATTNGSVKQVVCIVEAGAIAPVCKLLSETDSDLIEVILIGIENILRTGKEISNSANSTENRFATFVKQCGGFDKITLLSSHNDQKIAQKASTLIEKYFA